MSRPPVIVDAASRDQEQARAAFKRRTRDITARLATWPGLVLRKAPPNGDDVHGQQNVVLHARLDDSPVVVKAYADTPSAARCAVSEAAAVDRYTTFGLPVPQVLDLRTEQLDDATACTVLVLSELPGRPLSADLPDHGPSVAAAAGTKVGQLLAVQHHAERLPVTSPDVMQASWQRIRRRYEQTLTQELGVQPKVLAAMDQRASQLPDPGTLGWVTFDWRLRHLLWDTTTITGLLDLEYVKPADSAVELANLLHDAAAHLDPGRYAAFGPAVRAAYEERIPAEEHPSDERLLFCMARQAFSHAAVKYWQGITDNRIADELSLAFAYLDAASLDEILRRPR